MRFKIIELVLIHTIFITGCNTSEVSNTIKDEKLNQILHYDSNEVLSLVRNENDFLDMKNEFEFYNSGELKRQERMIYDPRVMMLTEFPNDHDSIDWSQFAYTEETFYWGNSNPKSYCFYFKGRKMYQADYDSTERVIISSRGSSFFSINLSGKVVVGDTFRMLFLCVDPPAMSKKLSIEQAYSKKALSGSFRWLSKNWVYLEFIVADEGEHFERLILEISNNDAAIDTMFSNIYKYTAEPFD